MSDVNDDDWGWPDDDFPDSSESAEVDPAPLTDPFAADVSTVDSQETLDVDAEFFRVCARIRADNPIHAPIYRWLSRLPRTSSGNLRAISEHLVLALRLYVQVLESGEDIRLDTGFMRSGEGRPDSVGASSGTQGDPQRHRGYRDILRVRDRWLSESPDPGSRPASVPARPSVPRVPSTSSASTNKPDAGVSAQGSAGASFSMPASEPASESSSSDLRREPESSQSDSGPSGLASVARLARDSGGWT